MREVWDFEVRVDVEGGESLVPIEELEGTWKQNHVAVSVVWSLGQRPAVFVTGIVVFTLL